MSGLPAAKASALAVVSPTMTPPIRPGPAVAAMASTSSSVISASASACSINPVQDFEMGAAGDFRHHAAIGRVRFILAEHDIGKNFAGTRRHPAHHRGRGLVAAGFQA